MKQIGTISGFAGQPEAVDLMDGIPHGAAILDSRFRMIEMNSMLVAICGHSSEDACGMDADMIIKSSLGFAERNWRKLVENGSRVSIEADVITAQRKKIPVRLTIKPLGGQDEGAVGYFLMIEDISMAKEIEAKRFNGQAVHGLIGASQKMQELYESLPVLANTNATLLITGETGTGKDLLAETVHKASKRSGYPFIKVNCGAIPESLLESELFGHCKGAFTGAHSDKPGMFKLAQGGTLYLTEIGDLPLPLQVKLLTVLDDREFFPVGGSKKVSVDVRLIAGTHHDLRMLVSEGKFREDLFFRLNVLAAHMPSLRERPEDIALLLNHFLGVYAGNAQGAAKGFSKKAQDMLLAYEYPGNVRELRNIMEYAVAVCKGGNIEPKDLPQYISSPSSAKHQRMEPHVESNHRNKPVPETSHMAQYDSWDAIEKRRILDAMIATGGNRAKAANALGWSRSKLWRKIRTHGIG